MNLNISLRLYFFAACLACTAIGNAQKLRTTKVNDTGFTLEIYKQQLPKELTKFGASTQIDYRSATGNSAPGTMKLPVEVLTIAVPPGSKPEFIFKPKTINTIKQAFPAVQPRYTVSGDQQIVAVDEVPNGLQQSLQQVKVLGYFWYRDFYCASVQVPLATFNYTEQSISEIQSYDLEVRLSQSVSAQPIRVTGAFDKVLQQVIANAEIAEQFRGVPPTLTNEPANDWINYAGKYLKIGVYEDRIYRIEKSTLTAAGYNESINPTTFKLFNRGVEQKIFVQGESDNSFDAGDYIEFYGTKNYNPGSVRIVNPDSAQYTEYLNRYSDTSFYFLTWSSGQATQRAAVQSGAPGGVADTLKYFTELLHFEKDSLYQPINVQVDFLQAADSQSSKSWFWADVLVQMFRFNVTLKDVVPGKSASIYGKFVSTGSNKRDSAHYVAIGLKSNSVVSDTNMYAVHRRYAFRNERVVMGGSFPSDSLKEGLNIIALRNYNTGTQTNSLKLDWFELEVPKLTVANNESFYFEVKTADQSGRKTVAVKKLVPTKNATEYVVYRVKPDFVKIENAIKIDSVLYFSDTLAVGRAYIVQAVVNATVPPIIRAKSFVNLRLPRKADYLAITHAKLLNAAKSYTGFIKNSYSLDTALVLIDDIYDEFAYGYPEPMSVRAFVRATISGWSAPKPSYLSLLGTGCYDYKRKVFQYKGIDMNENLVPSFGEPVSDYWFVIGDGVAAYYQSMHVGRITSRTPEHLNSYLQKHQRHLTQTFNLWNKRVILFSGGLDDNQNEQLTMKFTNEVVGNIARDGAYGLDVKHFYKTFYPKTSFGPYSPNYVINEIAQGAAVISYVGHSGTATWDNTINNPDQLLNTDNRGSLVSDFGCSTNKFGEPDIDCFGKRFVNEGQSIAYVGNASLGFTSTTSLMSELYYTYLFNDSTRGIAAAHTLSKQYIVESGLVTAPYRYFLLSNVLLGDPVIELGIPQKTNLVVNGNEYFTLSKPIVSEEDSTVSITMRYRNIGKVQNDTIGISIIAMYNGSEYKRFTYRRLIPIFEDSVTFSLPINRAIGSHKVIAALDTENIADEYSKADNTYTFSFNVLASALRPIAKSVYPGESNPTIKILKPIAAPRAGGTQAIVQTDTTENFNAPQFQTVVLDTFNTNVNLTNVNSDALHYVRFRINNQDTSWSSTSLVRKSAKNKPYLVDTKSLFAKMQYKKSAFSATGITLKTDTMHFVLNSCGGNYKNFGALTLNDSIIVSGIGIGFYIAVYDSATMRNDTSGFFNYGNFPAQFDSLSSLIENIPFGKIVFMGIVTDGISDFGLYASNPRLKNAIKSLGGTRIGFSYLSPYVLMGKKGLAVGQAREFAANAQFMDTLQFDTTLYYKNKTGSFFTGGFSRVAKWKQLQLDYTLAGDAGLRLRPIVKRLSGAVDSLSFITVNTNTVDLSFLDTVKMQEVKFEIALTASSQGVAPVITSLALDFDAAPELGFNYETVRMKNSVVKLGQSDTLHVMVMNAGYSTAKQVTLLTEMLYSGRKDTVDKRVISSIDAGEKKYLAIPFNSGAGEKNRKFIVTIDSENSVTEYFEDNNAFELPFTVAVDSTLKPYITAYADSASLIDGDYISAKPILRFEMYDPTIDPITDSTFILSMFDNDDRVFFKNNSRVTLTTNPSNPKLKIEYRPEKLSNGEHLFEIKALSGSRTDTITYRVNFLVNDDLQIVDLYNYPNPFKDKTYFTFQLSKVPETFAIKIYTIAGRLIKTIDASSGSLKVGYNKSLIWDGRDGDGNTVASGVYLAKVIAKLQGKTISSTMKLAVVR